MLVLKLDYTDSRSIEQAAEDAAKALPAGLDCLISNAATLLQADATFNTMYEREHTCAT